MRCKVGGPWLVIAFIGLTLSACTGSPARTFALSVEAVADQVHSSMTNRELCEKEPATDFKSCVAEKDGFRDYCRKMAAAAQYEFERRQLPADYCSNPAAAEARMAQAKRQEEFDSLWATESYNIDLLQVTTYTRRDAKFCSTGSVHKIVVEGQISPDSSFAMSRILDRLQQCIGTSGQTIVPVSVSLRSGGGLLNDGYKMGATFREKGVTTVIEDDMACASSCAVAFLGGPKRIVEDEGVIMYHAPYFSGENVYGKRDIDCEVGEDALNELNAYYREMTDAETGDRLFERTMWYCSAEDGWVVKGGSAAELYGIATEK
ncbi:MAG: hypothetical protein P8M13_02395 [Luminiphilus sp.]|nr:hypothetical protein [Luminiphilus sp.]